MTSHIFIQDPTRKEEVCFFCGAEKQYHLVYLTTPKKYDVVLLEEKPKDEKA